MRFASLMLRLSCTTIVAITLGACAAGSDDAADQSSAINSANGDGGTATPLEGTHVRVIAGNLTSGNKQSWDPGDGIRILKGLKVDVALLQEFNYGSNTDADYKAMIGQAFEDGFYYTAETGVQIPNGVVSRWPIKESGTWEDPQVGNRAFQWARIDIPGDKDLWAVSMHLLTSNASRRQAEAKALVDKIKANVPDSDYLVMGGDFNTPGRTEAALSTFGAITRTTGPWPVDPQGKGGTNASRSKPYDWVIASRALDALEIPLVVGTQSFKNGLVFDSRTYNDLPSVAPVRKSDSGASNMQHMGVVREFVIPE